MVGPFAMTLFGIRREFTPENPALQDREPAEGRAWRIAAA